MKPVQAPLPMVHEDGCGQGTAGVLGLVGVDVVCCDLAARFWPKVAVTDTCWVWMGAVDRGYGRFAIPCPTNHGLAVRAYRWGYEHYVTPIPAEVVLDHVCRERACVRFDHLEVVRFQTNLDRGAGRSKGLASFNQEQQDRRRAALEATPRAA